MITAINYLSYRKRSLRLTLLNLFRNSQQREEAMTIGKAFVDTLIQQYKVVVFSKTYCPYCTKAKTALDTFKMNADTYHVVEIDKRNDTNEIQDYLQSITGARSVPRVFIGGRFFGGGDDTVSAQNSGMLEKKLAEAGAV